MSMYSGVVTPGRAYTPDDRYLLRLAQPKAATLRYETRDGHSNSRADADYLRSIGCQQHIIIVNPDRLDIHREDVQAASREFTGAMLQLGNEPHAGWSIGDTDDALYQHRWYVADVLRYRDELYPGVKLICPPLTCQLRDDDRHYYQKRATAWLNAPLNGGVYPSLYALYNQLDAIAVHAYDWWDEGELLKCVDFYHNLFPSKQLYITEYGISGPLPAIEKVRRYRQFVSGCRAKGRDYVVATMMFICGRGLAGEEAWPEYIVGEAVADLAFA